MRYTTGVLVLRSRVEAWLEVKKQTFYGGIRNVVDGQIEKNIRHDGISEKNILCQAYACTLDREDNLMTFMLPFSLVNLT